MVKVELGHKVNNSAHKITQSGNEVMGIVGTTISALERGGISALERGGNRQCVV